MAAHRRWLQFSLRGFLIALTAGCIWMGWWVEHVRKQRRAVEAIEAVGGVVLYDWQADISSWQSIPAQTKYSRWGPSPGIRYMPSAIQPPAPRWLRYLLGDHVFQTVKGVIFRTRCAVYGTNNKNEVIASYSREPDRAKTGNIQALKPQLHDLPHLTVIYLQGDEGSISEMIEHDLKLTFPKCRVVREQTITAIPAGRRQK